MKNLILEVDAKLKEYDELASQEPSNSEDNILKDTQDIASHSNLWKSRSRKWFNRVQMTWTK